tara:strand:- start:214 stop:453 length:240 start_codon:yes stop_codon:yes gene_type:complete
MIKHDYTALDAAILAVIKESGPVHGYAIDKARTPVRALVEAAPATVQWNVVAYRLQALRKAGLISFQRKPEGWVLVDAR